MKKSAKREKKPAAPENEKNLSGKGFSQKKEKVLYAVFSSWIRGCRLFLSFGRLFHVDLPQNYNRK